MNALEEQRDRRSKAHRLLLCILWFMFAAHPLKALDPSRHISQYGHTSWKIQDGVLKAAAYALAQTEDGYMWIGTRAGIIRFDGVRFTPWTPPEETPLPSAFVTALLGARDGSLWIGTDAGISHWTHGKLINYPELPGRVTSILQDHTGAVWISRSTVQAPRGALCRMDEATFHCHGEDEGVSLSSSRPALSEDRQGNLWIGAGETVVRWRPGSAQTFRLENLKSHELTSQGVQSLIATQDGSVWVGADVTGPGLGLQKLTEGTWKPLVTPKLRGDSIEIGQGLFLDREDTLWIGALTKGLYRMHGEDVEHFGTAEGLSGDSIHQVFEDREGNLWVATSQGIDFFRDIRVASFSTREGLGTEEVDSVIATRDGSVWVGGALALDTLAQGQVTSILTGKGLPGSQVTSLFEDRSGQLWVGIDNTLNLYKNGKFVPVTRADGSPTGVIVGITEDADGNVWAEITGAPRRLLRIRDGKTQEEFTSPPLPVARKLAGDPNDPQNRIWMGLMDGNLARFQHGSLEVVPVKHASDARIEQLAIRSDGVVFASAAFGFIASSNGKQQVLNSKNGLPCDGVYSFVFDTTGDIWLYTQCALLRLSGSDLQRWLNHSTAHVQPKVFDEFDGVQPGRAPFQGAARSSDGRLWFANGIVLQMIDPARLNENATPPPVQIEDLLADRKSYGDQDGVHLPPLTHDIEIDYTALSFVVPQKVRFRYKLEGRESAWMEAGTRRQVYYTDLRPGHYRFRVLACNNDGVWNEQGATLEFVVNAAWYQMAWFRMLCVLSGLCMAVLFYRYRVTRLSRTLNASFNERLAERTRIARELHDTFVQTIQGSKFVADNVLDQPNDHVRMRQALEHLSAWLGKAVEEGRAALDSLRISTTQTNDLAAAFRRATEVGVVPASMSVQFSVVGEAREMHPIVRDEIYRIGYEAIRNACMHSGANLLEVEIRYAEDLVLRVKDNGVGMSADIMEHGRSGHFGLKGMRERAEHIQGKLTLVSSPTLGTELKLVVPGAMIFRHKRQLQTTLSGRIKRFFKR